jgi:hypothetical protein
LLRFVSSAGRGPPLLPSDARFENSAAPTGFNQRLERQEQHCKAVFTGDAIRLKTDLLPAIVAGPAILRRRYDRDHFFKRMILLHFVSGTGLATASIDAAKLFGSLRRPNLESMSWVSSAH